MKPPTRDDIDSRATAGLLEEIDLAVRTGRLVGLLKGRGLNKSTIEELLRPESALRLRAILNDLLYLKEDHRARTARRNNEEGDPGHGPAQGLDQGRKVLAYRR